MPEPEPETIGGAPVLPAAQQSIALGIVERAPIAQSGLRDRFLIPPFSVLRVESGEHQERRRQWLGMGIEAELGGRDEQLLNYPKAMRDPQFYTHKTAYEKRIGRELTTGEFYESDGYVAPQGQGSIQQATSIFDPVVAEAALRWWCPPAGKVLDPFAGGAVRGIVAAVLERPYVGTELRRAQVEANVEQAKRVFAKDGRYGPTHPSGKTVHRPTWVEGDATELPPSVIAGAPYAAILSCPPYADLEQYSKDPRDLSNMPWPMFRLKYRQAIAQACELLEPHSFACWVIGEIRSKKAPGLYRGLVPLTIDAFQRAGLAYYNELIINTPAGTLPLRAGRFMRSSGKIGKSHQQLLVFAKGDPIRAAGACEPERGV